MYLVRKILLTALVFATTFGLALGQYQNFSQFNFSPDRINPGKFLKKDEASLRTVYRTINSNLNLNLNTFYASGTYPLSIISSDYSWGAFTFSVFNDATTQSGLFNTTELNLGYTHMLQIGELQTLSFGISARHNNKGINLRNYTTGSQFNPGLGFDPSIGIGENFDDFESRFYSVGTGIYLKGTDLLNKKYYLGISFYDINRPNESVLDGESSIPITIQAEGGYHIYEDRQYGIIPSFLYTRSGGTDLLNIGSAFQYKSNESKILELHTRYRLAKAFILGLQYHTPNFSMGFSYDLPTGVRNDVFNNALEVGLELRKGIIPNKRIKKNKEKNKKREKRSKNKKKKKGRKKKKGKTKTGIPKIKSPEKENVEKQDNQDILESNTPAVIENTSTTDSVNQSIDKNVEIKVGKLQTEKSKIVEERLQTYFDFNTTQLNAGAKESLNNWAEDFKNRNLLKLIIIGHTDNVGSKEINQQISLKRANAIKNYLVELGIDSTIIVVKGAGMLQPAFENTNEIGRSKNRRVELIMIANDAK